MFLTGFSGDNGDPDNFLIGYSTQADTCRRRPSHQNPEVEKLMDEAARVPDMAKRVALTNDPATDKGRCAVGVCELGPGGPRRARRCGLSTEPDADVLRHGSGFDREVMPR
jgi:hypothetical protein